jgi:hypothetical protein
MAKNVQKSLEGTEKKLNFVALKTPTYTTTLNNILTF